MTSFYVPNASGGFDSQPSTGSPWGDDSQHGGPPGALLTRAIERLPEAEARVIGRITIELLGPVPVGSLSVTASVARPGRSVALVEAVLCADRPVARASAWLFPTAVTEAAPVGPPPAHGPADGEEHPSPPGWGRGYLDSVEWRWIEGSVMTPGPALVWMRPTVSLVDGDDWSPVQRLMACVDSASGASARLDPRQWGFLNTELTVHVLRPPVGEWVCLEAETTLTSGSVGLATSHVYDEQGLVARSAQALLIVPRS